MGNLEKALAMQTYPEYMQERKEPLPTSTSSFVSLDRHPSVQVPERDLSKKEENINIFTVCPTPVVFRKAPCLLWRPSKVLFCSHLGLFNSISIIKPRLQCLAPVQVMGKGEIYLENEKGPGGEQHLSSC